MGYPRAIQAHQRGDLETAAREYQRALEQGFDHAEIFQNFGALQRSRKKLQTAMALYQRGLELHPGDPGLLLNRSNLRRETAPAQALADLLLALRQPKAKEGIWLSAIQLLRDLQAPHWSLSVGLEAVRRFGPTPKLLCQILVLVDGSESTVFATPAEGEIDLAALVEEALQRASEDDRADLLMGLAHHALSTGEGSLALQRFDQALALLSAKPAATTEDEAKRREKVDVNSWNFSCALLQHQQFERGWTFYEHGLLTPAEGRQRWQRALTKPFSQTELPLWRGESLQGQRLLLLGEQAVGDEMMFATLLPTLIQEADRVGLLLSGRLKAIYQRSLGDRVDVWSLEDLKAGRLTAALYTRQSAIGSICRHRFTNIESYAPQVPMLKPDVRQAQQLRRDYLQQGGERLVGISWSGGGRKDRIAKKSIPDHLLPEFFAPIPGVRFVSLQYGQVDATLQRWRERGLDVIHDASVDPLKNMDRWLDQVAACDAVLSVANTTIHGAGGLNIPTLCLLSRHHDWRWLHDERIQRSYWYPSVGIARETRQGWRQALQQTRNWLESGCPMPAGPRTL